MSYIRLLFLLTMLSSAAMANPAVAILTKSGGAHIVRHSDMSELSAVDGELLFDGDSLLIPDGTEGSAEFRVCPATGASKTFRLTKGRAEVQGGAVAGVPEILDSGSLCLLPDVELDPVIGMMTERSLNAEPAAASITPADLARMTAADRASLQSLDATLKRTPSDLPARVTRAVLLQRNGLNEAAASELLTIGHDWPDEQWARTLSYTIATRKAPATAGTGKLYAAFIGISKYQQPNVRGLHYADADANLFLEFMTKTRAQVFSTERLYLPLINENANSTSVRTKLKAFFDNAQESDSILLYIAAHGVGDNKSDSGYVILYDTHLESTYDNSLSMEWIRELFVSEAARVRHVFLFVDTCHADRIGPIRNFEGSDAAVAKAAKVITDGKVFAMYASGANQESFENSRYGGGHGAFTYFLMRALNITSTDPDYKKADVDGNGSIDADELVAYVEDSVKADTHLKQSPKDDVRIDSFDVSTKLPGLTIAPCCGSGKPTAVAGVLRDPTIDPRGLEWTPPSNVQERVDWEEKSQQILYKYLQGEEVAPIESDYAAGLDAIRQARSLAGESLYLEAREEFFAGRLLLFSKAYDDAVMHLEKAIRMDPASPYAFNALGIAWLELGRYDAAEAAFNDAIRRAVNWAYPRHNLALVYLQRGDYARAIATYRDASGRAPQYSYLPYNLGLIYQRLNDEDEAARAYRLALKNAPDRAAPLVALGALMAEHGRNGKARDYYRQAQEVLAKNPEREVLLNLRHNEGVLEARSKSGLEPARSLWQANIDDADYLPSRFALARAFAAAAESRGHPDAMAVALAQYEEIVARVPDNIGARIEEAALLYRAKRTNDAVQVIEKGLAAKPGDATLTAALGKIRSGRSPQ
jgi:tetratricopeptide (TPR) repeat protein/uncharacterized caspase-like protein